MSLQEDFEYALGLNTPANRTLALRIVLQQAKQASTTGLYFDRLPHLVAPHGVYALEDPDQLGICIEIDRCSIDWQGSEVQIPESGDGIVLKNWSKCFGAHVRCATGRLSEVSSRGIVLSGNNATLSKCWVRDVGTGIALSGTNVNNNRITDCFVWGAWDVGLLIDAGSDNQGNLFESVKIQGAGRTKQGFLNRSFLGNTYVGCGVEATIVGTWWLDDPVPGRNPGDTYLGCDSEAAMGKAGVRLPGNCVTVGGTLSAYSEEGDRLGQGRARIRFGDGPFHLTIPHAADFSYVTYWHDEEGFSKAASIRRHPQQAFVDLYLRGHNGAYPAIPARYSRSDHQTPGGIWIPVINP